MQWWQEDRSIAQAHSQTGTVTAGEDYGESIVTALKKIDGAFRYASYTVVVSPIPITGYEKEYNPQKWDGDAEDNTVCYNYALNCQTDILGEWLTMLPGSSDPSTANLAPEDKYTKSEIVKLIEKDAAYYGFYFKETQKNHTYEAPEGAYLVALYVCPGKSYHWYRQDPDGMWSHKPGGGAVTREDFSGNPIYDPDYANRDLSGDHNYWQLVGFFYVTPLDRIKE